MLGSPNRSRGPICIVILGLASWSSDIRTDHVNCGRSCGARKTVQKVVVGLWGWGHWPELLKKKIEHFNLNLINKKLNIFYLLSCRFGSNWYK